jgi:uncharacterized membrane protein YccC
VSRTAIEWRSLHTHFLEWRVQLAFSLRVTVAAVLSLVLSLLLNVPLPLWTVLTAVILTQANFGRSVKTTIDYLIGTLGGAVYAGAVATLVPHSNEIALAGVLALAVAPLALLGALNPAFGAATFTGVLVLLIPGFAHVGPVESAIYRVLEVAIGAIAALAVSLVVLPTRAHSLAIENAAQVLDLMARSLRELLPAFMKPLDVSAIGRIQDSIGQAYARLDAIAADARHERIGFLTTEPDQGPLLRTLLRLRHDLVMIGRAVAEPFPQSFQAHLGTSITHVAGTAADYLAQSGDALTARREAPPLEAAGTALDGYAEAFAAVRRQGLTQGLPVDTAERIFTLGFTLEQMHNDFRDLNRCVREVARGR